MLEKIQYKTTQREKLASEYLNIQDVYELLVSDQIKNN